MFRLPVPGETIGDKYRIEALLGEGGMGAVFRARHELMGKPVALKWLRPSLVHDAVSRDRFIREARAMARVRHPNVVDVYDVGVHEGALFLIMELLEGETFEALLERQGLTIPEALRLIIDSMRGVAAAHRANIIHRDIKPENIFIAYSPEQPAGTPKVLDFGVSKLTDDTSPAMHITRSGATMGTPLYMSYEQMHGASDVDARTDIYSFGVLLYRTLTGRLPFEADNFAALAVAIASERPPSPKQLRPELPATLDQVVMKAISLDRAQRHASVDELINDLTLLASTEGFVARMSRPVAATPRVGNERAVSLPKTESPSSTPPINFPVPRAQTHSPKRYLIALALVGVAVVATGLFRWRASTAGTRQLEPAAVRGIVRPVTVTPVAAPPPEAVAEPDKIPALPAGLSAPNPVAQEPIEALAPAVPQAAPRAPEPVRKTRRAAVTTATGPAVSPLPAAQPPAQPAVVVPAVPVEAPAVKQAPASSQSADGVRSGTLRRDRL